MSSASVEVGKLKRYPQPATPFETDIVGLDLRTGNLSRNQFYTRYGLLGIFVAGDPLSGRESRTDIVWAPELMKYSRPFIEIRNDKADPALIVTPRPNEGRRVSLEPVQIRGQVNDSHIGGATVSEEGFAFFESDLRVPSGVERPLGETLQRGMETGETTDLLGGNSYVWVGPEHAGKSLFVVAFGGSSSRYYHDAVVIGPMRGDKVLTYDNGERINTVYSSRVVQVKKLKNTPY